MKYLRALAALVLMTTLLLAGLALGQDKSKKAPPKVQPKEQPADSKKRQAEGLKNATERAQPIINPGVRGSSGTARGLPLVKLTDPPPKRKPIIVPSPSKEAIEQEKKDFEKRRKEEAAKKRGS